MNDQLLAQGIVNPALEGTVLDSLLQAGDPAEFLGPIISRGVGLTLVVGTVLFFFMFAFGAIAWITSGGDKGTSENARNKITNSLVGLIILFSSFAVMLFIENFFGVNILTIDIGPLAIP